MAERDAFELRLTDALRAYAADAPTDARPIELVRRLAAAHHRGRTTIGPVRLGLTPAFAWLLLICLLVLTATTIAVGAGMLWSRNTSVIPPPATVAPASVAPAPLVACPAGTTPDQPGPEAQVRPPMEFGFSASVALDRRAGRFVTLAGGITVPVQTWTFDVCSNTWTQMHPTHVPYELLYHPPLVYDVDSDVTVAIAGDRALAYNLEADRWTAMGPLPASLKGPVHLAYDTASGLIVVMGGTSDTTTGPWGLWAYDVETDTWTALRQAGRGLPAAANFSFQWLTYDASVDRLVLYRFATSATSPYYGFETWLFDLRSGTWSRGRAEAPGILVNWYGGLPSGGEMAYDEATRQTIVFSRGRVVAYDATNDRWNVLVQGVEPGQPLRDDTVSPRYTDLDAPVMAYDSVNRRLIVYGGSYPSTSLNSDGSPIWVRSNDVLSFDPVSRQWSVLLAASVVEPAR